MRKLSVLLANVLVILTLLTACFQSPPSTVEPGDGPAASESAMDEPVEGESSDGSGDDTDSEGSGSSEQTASFDQKITYPDGVEVEVISIKESKISFAGVSDDLEEGDPYSLFSIRVRNGSSETLDVGLASVTVSYGPDGEEAEQVYDRPTDSMDGKVISKKAKTGSYGFAIPKKYRDDVVLEFSLSDFEHGTAIFSGSVS